MDDLKKLGRRDAVMKLGKLSFAALVGKRGSVALSTPVIPISPVSCTQSQHSNRRIPLVQVTIVVDPSEPSYIQCGVEDLAEYLREVNGAATPKASSLSECLGSPLVVGRRMCEQVMPGLLKGRELGPEGFLIRSGVLGGRTHVLVAGVTPRGTNFGLANLLRMIRVDSGTPYLEKGLEIQSTPRFPLRGIHLNGWPISFPYGFRVWQEKDWQRFIDLVWLQGANLFLLWPSKEIMPVPLSSEDEAYLEEVRRVVNYAKEQRGMQVWIMHSANRIAASDCDVRDPRPRPYWVDRCQEDMNPADPRQFKRIMESHEAFYRIVNNADGYCMIDSDPGGWPQSPIRDQVKIFKGARALLNRYHLQGAEAKLVDWMWVGWGRHKFFGSSGTVVAQYDWTDKNPDASDLAFMAETIHNFQQNLPEPWWLVPGFPQYLGTCKKAAVLGKTVYLPYGAIEYEPAFPATNVPLDSVRNALEALNDYPETQGIMGNNQTPLLQLPRTYFFLRCAWDYDYRNRNDRHVLLELSELLYPDHKELIADSFFALEQSAPREVESALDRLRALVSQGREIRAGALGRKLFPDRLAVARSLVFQLKIRAARQRLLDALTAKPTRDDCARLVEDYLDSLLVWNKETGWGKMINLGLWRGPIYASDKKFGEALSVLKRILGEGAHTTSYATIASFFAPIADRLRAEYDEGSVMVGCIEPLKLAVIQAP